MSMSPSTSMRSDADAGDRRVGGITHGQTVAERAEQLLHGIRCRVAAAESGRLVRGRRREAAARASACACRSSGLRPSRRKPHRRRPRAPVDLAGIRVLCVADDADTCMALEEVLRQAGCTVRTAQSVAEGLRIAAAQAPDVVVTDLAMPEQDGYALLEGLRSLEGARHAHVIALTAAATPEERQRVTTQGFALFLAKPVEASELLTAVRMTVSGLASQFARQRSAAVAPN